MALLKALQDLMQQNLLQPEIKREIERMPVLGNSSIAPVQARVPQVRPIRTLPDISPQQNGFEPMQPGGARFVTEDNATFYDGQGFSPKPEEPWYKRMTDDPAFMDRLAMGFNTMRLDPDQGLAAVLGDRIKTVGEMSARNKTAEQVAVALQNRGFFPEAAMVEGNPALAKEFAKLLTKGSSDTETVQTRKQIAAQLGHAPGSPEYNAILTGGKPSDITKEEWEKGKGIRGEFVAIPAVKSFSEQSQAFGRIIASAENPSPAGDLALIFNYMKVLDPGSTVREGEFANAQNAGGVDDRIVSLYNQVMKGTRLSESQRADFVGRAERLYKNAEQGYAKTEKFYRGLAERSGLKPEDVIPDYRYGGSRPPRMLVKPAEVPQATWDAMTQDQKKRFLEAGS
jgi:hypothetical protein